jgi:glutathione S-transferase
MARITNPGVVGIPPNLWPPALELANGKWLSQTGVIINYLSPKLGLAGYAKDDTDFDEEEKIFLGAKNAQLVLTVLDMAVEVSIVHSRGFLYGLFREPSFQLHGVHHPVSVNLYYEDQKAEALRSAEQFRASRLPKYFQYFQTVLETNPANKGGKGTSAQS